MLINAFGERRNRPDGHARANAARQQARGEPLMMLLFTGRAKRFHLAAGGAKCYLTEVLS